MVDREETDGIVNNSWRWFKERRKRKKWVRLWIRKKASKEAYYSIINDLNLTDKVDFRKCLRINTLTVIPIFLFYLSEN